MLSLSSILPTRLSWGTQESLPSYPPSPPTLVHALGHVPGEGMETPSSPPSGKGPLSRTQVRLGAPSSEAGGWGGAPHPTPTQALPRRGRGRVGRGWGVGPCVSQVAAAKKEKKMVTLG